MEYLECFKAVSDMVKVMMRLCIVLCKEVEKKKDYFQLSGQLRVTFSTL